MALWGNNDNIDSAGTVTLDYATGICTGSNLEAQSVLVLVLVKLVPYKLVMLSDLVILLDIWVMVVVSIASTTSLTIGSTMGLSGVGCSNHLHCNSVS